MVKTKQVRVYYPTASEILKLSREIKVIENKDVTSAEVIKRAFNIPNIKKILKDDAQIKRGRHYEF